MVKVSVGREKLVSVEDTNTLRINRNDMTTDKYYIYCRLKLKDYIFRNYKDSIKDSDIEKIHYVIDNIPLTLYDSINTETSAVLLMNYMVYELYGKIFIDAAGQAKLYNEVIKFLHQYDPRII